MREYSIILAADLPSSAEVLAIVRQVGLIVDGIKRECTLFYTLTAADSLLQESAIPRSFLEHCERTAPELERIADVPEKRSYPSKLDFGDFLPYIFGERLRSGFPLAPRGRRGFLPE